MGSRRVIIPRFSDARGTTDLGWLHSRHTFSFGDYYDPEWTSFGPLRVINDDVVGPDAGFPMHPHRNMEIITYVLEGAIEHRDSSGGHAVVRPGEVQRMTAGRGIRHSEFNVSKSEPVHLLQIWIEPREDGLEPSYEQIRYLAKSDWTPIATPEGGDGAVKIHQDARIHLAIPTEGDSLPYDFIRGRRGWIHLARGEVSLGQVTMRAGDAVGFTNEKGFLLNVLEDSELLLFDLPESP